MSFNFRNGDGTGNEKSFPLSLPERNLLPLAPYLEIIDVTFTQILTCVFVEEPIFDMLGTTYTDFDLKYEKFQSGAHQIIAQTFAYKTPLEKGWVICGQISVMVHL